LKQINIFIRFIIPKPMDSFLAWVVEILSLCLAQSSLLAYKMEKSQLAKKGKQDKPAFYG
jgi:hypothetical protein